MLEPLGTDWQNDIAAIQMEEASAMVESDEGESVTYRGGDDDERPRPLRGF